MASDAWRTIPFVDYEGHMESVGQAALLRRLFASIYAKQRPAHVLVLGCTTGADFAQIDPAITSRLVGVDCNDSYLEEARRRHARLAGCLQLHHADVLEVDLGAEPFDLVHAALLLEYVEPRRLFERLRSWLGAGGLCSLVTQEPSDHVAAVSPSPYTSLRRLSERMCLHSAAAIAEYAASAKLCLQAQLAHPLPSGKLLTHSLLTPLL